MNIDLYWKFTANPFRRGDIILFTENACDIVYLEEMYSRKIRELYEQQIKTVDDLNRSILFYGSKTPVRKQF